MPPRFPLPLPAHPDQAVPCHTPPQRPRPTRAVAESELASALRCHAQNQKSIQQLRAYLATL